MLSSDLRQHVKFARRTQFLFAGICLRLQFVLPDFFFEDGFRITSGRRGNRCRRCLQTSFDLGWVLIDALPIDTQGTYSFINHNDLWRNISERIASDMLLTSRVRCGVVRCCSPFWWSFLRFHSNHRKPASRLAQLCISTGIFFADHSHRREVCVALIWLIDKTSAERMFVKRW